MLARAAGVRQAGTGTGRRLKPAGVLEAARTQGILPSFIPLDRSMETVATADIGDTAAMLLREPVPAGTRVMRGARGPADVLRLLLA